MSAEQAETHLGTLSVFELMPGAVDSLPPDQTAVLECFQVSPADTALMQDLMENTGIYEPNTVARRLGQGRWGFAGRMGQTEIVTYGWVALDATSVGPTGLDFVPPIGDAYLFDFATLPAHRGHGYYPFLLRFIQHHLAKHSLRRAWIATAPGNDKSARSIARAGFTKVADTLFVPSSPLQPAYIKLFAAPGINPALVELGYQAHVPNAFY